MLVLYTKLAVSRDMARALQISPETLGGLSVDEVFALMATRLLPEKSKTRDGVVKQMREWKA